ncbi:hypothetical protein MTO96_026194 [Rhipicephalus appendiculatus]
MYCSCNRLTQREGGGRRFDYASVASKLRPVFMLLVMQLMSEVQGGDAPSFLLVLGSNRYRHSRGGLRCSLGDKIAPWFLKCLRRVLSTYSRTCVVFFPTVRSVYKMADN